MSPDPLTIAGAVVNFSQVVGFGFSIASAEGEIAAYDELLTILSKRIHLVKLKLQQPPAQLHSAQRQEVRDYVSEAGQFLSRARKAIRKKGKSGFRRSILWVLSDKAMAEAYKTAIVIYSDGLSQYSSKLSSSISPRGLECKDKPSNEHELDIFIYLLREEARRNRLTERAQENLRLKHTIPWSIPEATNQTQWNKDEDIASWLCKSAINLLTWDE